MKSINSFSNQRARYPAFCFPNIFSALGLCEKSFFKETGHKLSYVAFLLSNNKRRYIFGERDDIEKIKNIIINKILKKKRFIKNKYNEFKDKKKKLITFTRKNLTEKKLKKATNKELFNLLIKYYNKYKDFCSITIPFILFVNEPLETEIKKRIKSKHEFLLQCPKLSYTSIFELDYFEKCKKIAKQLHKRWGWIPFDYIGPEEWNKTYFMKKMNIDIKRIKEIIKNNKLLREKQEKVLKEYNSKIRRLVKDFHYIVIMQDKRKGIATITHTYLQKYLFNEISQRTGIKIHNLRVMIPSEIREALLLNKKFDNKLLEQRSNNCLVLYSNNYFSVHLGKDRIYKRFIELLPIKKKIKGIVASKGIVEGTVKVCLTSKDIHKVNEGDILVAPMTTPDYITAMNKAAGFITDEGGITCHAAIISREMKKPCIIGTHSATDILKDGDYIELDANKGIVRKIKNAPTEKYYKR